MSPSSVRLDPPAAVPPLLTDDELFAAVATRVENRPKEKGSTNLLWLTAILFVGLGGLRWGWASTVSLLVAIGLHEVGHVIAMRWFGYKNVRLLFIPLFGGLATGEPDELDATRNALVALAGPAFGMLTAIVAAVVAVLLGSPRWLLVFSLVSVGLNALNLIPLVPLDGGVFANDTLFSRFPVVELIFRLLAIAALGWFALAREAWMLGALALFMLVMTPVAFRRARLVREARRDPSWQTRELDRDAVIALRAIVTRIFASVAPHKYQKHLPAHVHSVWLEIRKRFPGPGAMVGLVLGYLFLCLVMTPICAVVITHFLKLAPP